MNAELVLTVFLTTVSVGPLAYAMGLPERTKIHSGMRGTVYGGSRLAILKSSQPPKIMAAPHSRNPMSQHLTIVYAEVNMA